MTSDESLTIRDLQRRIEALEQQVMALQKRFEALRGSLRERVAPAAVDTGHTVVP